MAELRQATRADIPGMHRVRLAVRENRLTSAAITEADYIPAIEVTGRGERGEEVAYELRASDIIRPPD